jgi:hypothetical protein
MTLAMTTLTSASATLLTELGPNEIVGGSRNGLGEGVRVGADSL